MDILIYARHNQMDIVERIYKFLIGKNYSVDKIVSKPKNKSAEKDPRIADWFRFWGIYRTYKLLILDPFAYFGENEVAIKGYTGLPELPRVIFYIPEKIDEISLRLVKEKEFFEIYKLDGLENLLLKKTNFIPVPL